ncbi:hypothetical protein F4776DRAFT_156223 [Hypoxylon sp. NC0597]|nr:hypothetical protein F4776DRAFT_156223 [Hypoxylon sp. NC0597]
MSSSTQDIRVCQICHKSLTKRSYAEHTATTHLGLICYFPGSDFQLEEEDDSQMTDALIRANEQRGGGGHGLNKEGKLIYWCFWPDCRGEEKVPHSYESAESLKRHLRTKQRDMHRQLSPNWNLNPRILNAWNEVNRRMGIRDAKFECLGVVANADLDAEIQRVRLLTYINDAVAIWDDFSGRDAGRQNAVLFWASDLGFNTDPNFHILTWQYFYDEHATLSGILKHLEQMTIRYPDLQ